MEGWIDGAFEVITAPNGYSSVRWIGWFRAVAEMQRPFLSMNFKGVLNISYGPFR